MFPFRRILPAICALIGAISSAIAQQHLSDSLRNELAHTEDPATRVQLLLNLKDLNEDSGLNLPYSIQLFHEASAIRDTYAMSVAIVPIAARFAPYPEKEDTLRYYMRTLRSLAPGTPEEGLDSYTEMAIGFGRLRAIDSRKNLLRKAHAAIAWSDSLATIPGETVYRQAERLVLRGYANLLVEYYERNVPYGMKPQIPLWKKAYDLTHEMPNVCIRRAYAEIIYYLLSGAYNQAMLYDEQVALMNDFNATLDSYYNTDKRLGRRPYLYADNSYVRPYQQLIRCALNLGREDLADKHFLDFRERMLDARGTNLVRNKTYLYELGYLLRGIEKRYDESILYSDSLVNLVEHGLGYYGMQLSKVYKVYNDRSILQTNAGHYDEAFESYAHTFRLQDSIFRSERAERSEALRRRQEIDRLKLHETRAQIRNRAAVLFSFIALGILLLGTGIHFFRAWRRNRRLQRDIARHSRRAQESERMKSIFVNTICRGIGPPLDSIDRAAHALMIAGIQSPGRLEYLEAIRENTDTLLSTLDNMLEAANLDSLTGQLHLEPTDVDEICRAELLSASRLRHNSLVDYRIETPGEPCTVRTHPKYFTFVIRALLDNAGKYTRMGSVTLRYETDNAHNELRISVSDTGCGIAPERRERIFHSANETGEGSRGMSLPLCRVIVGRLSGSLRIDGEYGPGARFIFTIPLQP